MIGRTVSHYRITEKLGEGGMGVVYRAEDTVLGRAVAVKFLPPSGDGQRFRARFLREARAASQLTHPNIATVHDYGETPEGEPFIVMELVEGRTLDELLRSDPPPDLRGAVKIVERVGRALAEAHRRGIVHRDVKPSNVIVGERGAVKVLDFGLAKQSLPALAQAARPEAATLIGARTAENVILGTPLYLSPEQAAGGEVDARSDLFSLGAVLYECLAGRPAFGGASVLEIFRQVQGVNPPPPSALNPRVPPALDRVVMKALAKRPEDRYQSAEEMLEELRAARGALAAGEAGPPRTVRAERAAGTSRISQALRTLERLRRPRYYVPALAAVACAVAASMWAMRAGGVPPPHPKAVERFEEGTKALRDGTYYKASKLLSDAVRIDPRFALAHARLAEAWMELDYTDRARDAMMTAQALAREHSGPLRPLFGSAQSDYVEAIDATIRRDFPKAVRLYAGIAARSPSLPQAYVDLGRAHERNEDADRAIESYQKAAELEPREAAAFLRLGVLHGRKQNLPAARDSFSRAEEIYQNTANYEGLAEVYLQRGILANRTAKLPEARALLGRALATAETTGNKYQQIRALLGLSGVVVTQGRIDEGKRQAARALDLARADRIENLTAQGLVSLGRAFFLLREYQEAESYFKQALAFAEQSGGRRGAAQAHLALAGLYIQQEHRTGDALPHLDQALAFFRQGGYSPEVSQALLLSGRAKLQRGDYETALAEFDQQKQIAKQIGDLRQLVNSEALVGAALAERELYAEALHHFREGYEASRSAGIPLNAAYALLNQGDMLWRLGRYAEARAALAQMPSAIEALDEENKQLLLGRTRLVGALLALSERRFDEARKEAIQALALADERLDAEVKYVLCAAQVFSGAGQAARRACDEAIKSAEHDGDPRLVANATLALAEAALEGGDARRAREAALKAQELFTRGGQRESGWRAWLTAGRASLRLGERETAREQLSRAEQTLSGLEQTWGAGAFRGYAARPDVQFYRKQLDEARAAVQ
jgi:tetratricopeptide (TPR) repeat protein/predicted Ser/Thr protein kinase